MPLGKQKQGARPKAFEVLNRVDAGAYADVLCQSLFAGLDQRERGLAQELVYGVLRWRMKLDFAIDSVSTIKTKKLEARVLNALRLGAYQLFFLTRVPASAAVNESVGLAPFRSRGFVNAVLRELSRRGGWPEFNFADKAQELSTLYSHPMWLVKRWIERFGLEDTCALLDADQKIPPRMLRVNTLKCTVSEAEKKLTDLGLEVQKSVFSPDGLEVINGVAPQDSALFYPQDEASQLVSLLVAPRPKERVLDACASPGGKTSHLGAMMQNTGEIIALEKHAGRLESLKAVLQRLGAVNVRLLLADATLALMGIEKGFDAVLLDAPCSGLGVIRRSPDIKYNRTQKDIEELSARQRSLIENLSAYVIPGGRLVYSVCTFEPEETWGVIDGFLGAHPEFSLESAKDVLPPSCAPLVGERGQLSTYPHVHALDGFFAVRLRRGSS